MNIRDGFRRFKSHNVIVIKEADKLVGLKFFGWEKIPRVKYKCIDIEHDYVLKVQHDGFKPFIISRKIIVSKDLETIEILDCIKSKKKHNNKVKIQLFFHFHENTHLIIHDNEIILNKNLKMSFNKNSHLDLKISKNTYYYSPSYGVKILAPLVKVEFFYIFITKRDLEIRTNILPLN